MQVVPVPTEFTGQFYQGDSYIILKTRLVETHLEWDIHFWLGSETSQDEQGVAAYKTVELDDSLGGAPVQYREVQFHESKRFMSYFKKGVKYLKGGVASGFKHVTPEVYEPRLMQCKGKRNIRVQQVDLGCASLNHGDVFILDMGETIYIWYGEQCGRMEKIKAIQVANGIRDDERAGRADVVLLDGQTNDEPFFEALGGRDDIQSADEGGADDENIKDTKGQTALYRVSDASGQLKAVKVSEGPLSQDMLDSQDCFIIDGGKSGIFVWIGKQSTKDERLGAMNNAMKYLKGRGYPNWTPITRCIDGGEPALFKVHFADWAEEEGQVGLGNVHVRGSIAPPEEYEGKELQTIHSRRKRIFNWGPLAKHGGRACGFMPDDGSGSLEVWRIEQFEMVPVDPSIHGWFFGGDSYILKYSYMKDNRDFYIVYFWQGLKSSQDEKAASAILAVKLDDEVGGKAVQVRVVQGEEPDHFLTVFKGKMVVFMGGRASGFRNVHDHDTYDVDGTRLFHIRGTSDVNTRAVQVPELASSLNSEDVFVLETPNATYIWRGKGADDVELDMATDLIPMISPDREPQVVDEGLEPDEFWDALGGPGEYPTQHVWAHPPALPPRLFQCTLVRNRLRVEEIVDFVQEDLDGDDVMILDSGSDEIYIWVGKGSLDEEKKAAYDLGMAYLKSEPSPRKADTCVFFEIKQGSEPETFTGYFENWDASMWGED
ncbi:PREDICTED: gelsolin, cytoplasmic-like isoform X2 [Priapulus caudatus]|uniref:Gelsolin, cytoplasmic-like isoform X2 n=1 Tax=Priapulus caudatus TaxID=37621 RepID=A0ABM1EHE8_PRICU|nr:PREDICTED: gelsolin, cytoplasmic-like isoform X2 [Priapulus caudatus]